MKVKVAVVQTAPVFFNKSATIDKVEIACAQASKEGCNIVIFPESFIPGYPRGFSFGTIVGGRTDEGRTRYLEYHNESISLDSEDLKRIEKIAAVYSVWVVLGITEKEKTSGSLFCTTLYISPENGLQYSRRKIKPTAQERVIWGEGGSEDLGSVQSPYGILGGLTCWENYMPLARVAMYQQGVQIYIAPTADAREEWQSSLVHIALESRSFVIGCNQYFTKNDLPEKYHSEVSSLPDVLCNGGSVVISPLGKIIAGPLWNESGVLIADLDMDEIIKSKLDFDPSGHYTRDDLFNFSVTKSS